MTVVADMPLEGLLQETRFGRNCLFLNLSLQPLSKAAHADDEAGDGQHGQGYELRSQVGQRGSFEHDATHH